MRHILLLLCLIAAVSPALAADGTGAATAGPNADSTPMQPGAGKQTAGHQADSVSQSENCPARPPLAQGAPSAISVELDPDTLWRPRGAEVRFTIRNPVGSVGVTQVRVCFGWSSPDGEFRKSQLLLGSPQVRSVSNDTGAVEYGAVVPVLPRVPDKDWWPRRMFSPTPYTFTGAFTVPVADMIVEVTTTAGLVVVTATQVGITNVSVAWVVVAGVLAVVWLIMNRVARYRGIKGRNLLLRIISTQDGYASLSQLQIVLWTLVVAVSAIYVMTLSGNLINISQGTLILLGIASGAALAARIPGVGQTAPTQAEPATPPATPQATPPAPTTPTTPEWADLIISDRSKQEIDVTRLQMLAFTLITAAFVMIKVVVDYEIPAIPANFLMLMGISNGVYVGGMKLPSQPKNAGVATDA
jgi:hypothetical protein